MIFIDRLRASAAVPFALAVMLGAPLAANADEADAKKILKSMSDYVAAQPAISFDYDAILEVVTVEAQTLGLASSGSVTLKRPDKLKATRAGGFVNVEMTYDGKTLTLFGKDANVYVQEPMAGTIDDLVYQITVENNRPLPAADLLLTDSYEALLAGVVDVKDLGSGVIGGVECNHFAFRADEVDWQIWIAQGPQPYPCRYSITSLAIMGQPQYSVQLSNWKAGKDVAAAEFSFKNTTGAEEVELEDLGDPQGLPPNFESGDSE